jgi:hypothetical protein
MLRETNSGTLKAFDPRSPHHQIVQRHRDAWPLFVHFRAQLQQHVRVFQRIRITIVVDDLLRRHFQRHTRVAEGRCLHRGRPHHDGTFVGNALRRLDDRGRRCTNGHFDLRARENRGAVLFHQRLQHHLDVAIAVREIVQKHGDSRRGARGKGEVRALNTAPARGRPAVGLRLKPLLEVRAEAGLGPLVRLELHDLDGHVDLLLVLGGGGARQEWQQDQAPCSWNAHTVTAQRFLRTHSARRCRGSQNSRSAR